MAGRRPQRKDAVFINCPFDAAYWPRFEVVVFTIYACGFVPRCALEEIDAGDNRLDKIVRMIEESRYGIHDLSRVELDDGNRLPRFNMPFELGLDIGAKKLGRYKDKRLLVLDTDRFRYQRFLSDIAGQDISAYDGSIDGIIRVVRDFLRAASKRENVTGAERIREWYAGFTASLPGLCERTGINRGELSYPDYLQFVEQWLREVA